MSMLTFQKTNLSNGTRVVFVPHNDTAAATILVLFEVGSRYESKSLNGGSHFIEHMMFKGTERRPHTIDISRDLDSVGADYNAFTSKDYTGYYIKLQSDKLPLAVDMLEDMLYNSVYRPEDLASELNVILEEIHMYDDNPMMMVEELMEEELYKGSKLGWKISGTDDTMKGITRDPMIKYRDEYYVPSRTVIAVSGKFDQAQIHALLEEKFGKRKETGKAKPFEKFVIAKAGFRKPRIRIKHKETEQIQLAMGFPAYGYGDKRLPATLLLSVILGGTMSSRLFLNIREKNGLCYFIRASSNPYQDVGNFVIQSGLTKAKINQAIKLIIKELIRIKTKNVTDQELNLAREYIKGKMVLNLEESSNTADWFGKQELLAKKIQSPEEKIANLFKVTKDEIRAVAEDLFRSNRMTMALIGPFNDPAEFAKLASEL